MTVKRERITPEKLRRLADNVVDHQWVPASEVCVANGLRAAADEIERLQAENTQLRAETGLVALDGENQQLREAVWILQGFVWWAEHCHHADVQQQARNTTAHPAVVAVTAADEIERLQAEKLRLQQAVRMLRRAMRESAKWIEPASRDAIMAEALSHPTVVAVTEEEKV